MSGGGGSDDAIRYQREQVQKTYEYDSMMYHYQWSESAPTGTFSDGTTYAQAGLQPGQRGDVWKKYDQAIEKRQHAQLNANRQKLFQEQERQKSWEYSEDRRRFDYNVQSDVRNQQISTRDQQLNLNQQALSNSYNREQQVLNEQLLQAAFENRQVLQDFDFDTFSLGFKKEELRNQLGLSSSQIDAESKKASADLVTQQKLNAQAVGRAGTELQIRENELNTAAARSQLDLDTSLAKALTDSQSVQQQADLAEGKLLTEEQRAKTVLGQKTGDAQFQVAEAELGLQAKRGDVAATKQGLTEDFLVKDASNRFNRAALGIDTEQIKQRKDFQNDLISKEIESQKAKAAFSASKANLDSLNRVGQASVMQAGRSQGKNIVAYLSLVGQQQAEIVDSIVRAETVGQRKQRENKVQALNDIQRSAIKSQQLDLAALENLNKLSLGISEADRSLDLATTRTGLELGKIAKSVSDAGALTDLTVKDLQREISARRGLTATSLQDIQEGVVAKRKEADITARDIGDKRQGERSLTSNRISSLLDEIEGRQTQEGLLQSELNERRSLYQNRTDIGLRETDSELQRLSRQKGLNQDIIRATEDSARQAYGMNIADIGQAKTQADLMARSRVMPSPRMAPGAPAPQPLPPISYEPIHPPNQPPGPREGAKMSHASMGAGDYLSGAGMGALAGLSAYSALGAQGALSGLGLAAHATPIGIAVGLGTALASFF